MKYFLIIFILLFIVILFSGIFIWRGTFLPKEAGSVETVMFLIKKGEATKEISIDLEKQGLIKNSFFFRIYALIQGKTKELKAGEYELSPAMTIPEIVAKLVSGEIIKKTITIIEGWNLKDINDYLRDRGGTVPPKLDLYKKDYAFLEDASDDVSLEGYLFPDTYEISSEDGIEDIVRKMLTNFGKKLNQDLREEITSQGKSIFEIITMASLIEKEVKTLEDKKIVSDIFWKRLKIGKPLESCATIAYILGVNKWRYSFDDTRILSPYNTYLNRGLPFGPICNPGMESILAAIYPEESDYWFYLSTPEGKTIFSKTLGEHNIAKAKYLK